jgi:phage terminase large subunit-like protein
MSLSNTAVPKYYGEFREQVLLGHIPINEEIGLEMQRIDQLIKNPYYYYDDQAIEGFIAYCENELTLTDGSPFHMLDSFKLWAEQLLAWHFFVERSVYTPGIDNHGGHYETRLIKKRLTVKQYLIVARGAAKSMYAFCIQAYFLNIDTATTHQITTAPTMKQAEEVMQPFRTAITRAPGPLFKFLTEGSMQNTTGSRALRQKLASTKIGIQNFLTDSKLEIRPMSINKLQGLRPKISTVDEWLSGDVREDVIGAIEQGASKLDDYIIVAISSEGTVRNGAGDTVKMELAKILKGDGNPAPHISIFHYKLDSIDEVAIPAMWLKANPNLDRTISYDVYQQDVDRAENNPSVRNDILAKRFGIPMEGYTYYFTYEETIPIKPRNEFRFNSMPCAVGADLSHGDDFCAFTFLFPLRDEQFGVKTRSYITSNTMLKLPSAMRAKYEEFMAEGTLHVLEGITLDMMEVYEDLEKHILEHDYRVRAFGFDPYNAKEFMDRWEGENGPYGIVKVIQGARTESVPLGELKKLSEMTLTAHDYNQRSLIFDESLMQFAMGNSITLEDTNGNRKLWKLRQEAKIDNVAALMDAYIAFKANKAEF